MITQAIIEDRPMQPPRNSKMYFVKEYIYNGMRREEGNYGTFGRGQIFFSLIDPVTSKEYEYMFRCGRGTALLLREIKVGETYEMYGLKRGNRFLITALKPKKAPCGV